MSPEGAMPEYVEEFGKDGRPVEADGRLDAAAFHRNHQAIWAALEGFLAGKSGDVVEAGSGTGQHVVDFARRTPEITWWPSDLNEQHLKSIAAWREYSGLPNVRPPLRIDLSDPAWCPEMHDGSGPGKLLAVFWLRAPGAPCDRTGGCSSTGRSSATASIPRSAMPCSTPAFATTMPNGACAISRPWRSWRQAPALR
jgi:hypothetical protein